ncbi:TRAP transporter small permease [Paracoccus sp. SCSIO 75233]|uniref:TRAP transporter small permease n=1 Tax=Paracoccus sp. SCSIO 75233 TaxID=3017782 RepID=UPI0022F0194C|nr:TRAP transporter small permease subunit [Paracoccus sp. SCSIO 75233]WBU52053.1 TRAP transporter small permease subunit [Paracoccus sp. SCSIO 75233]
MAKNSTSGLISFSRKILGLIDSFMGKIESVILTIAAVAALLAMCVISLDALGRYLFNQPLIITIDLISRYLLPIIMLSTASVVLRQSKHISVDLFAMLLPYRLYLLLLGIGMLVAVPVFWIMAWRVAHSAAQSFEAGSVTYGLIPWPIWVEQAIYAVCIGLLEIRIVQVAIANLFAAITGETSIGIPLVNAHDDPLEEGV